MRWSRGLEKGAQVNRSRIGISFRELDKRQLSSVSQIFCFLLSICEALLLDDSSLQL